MAASYQKGECFYNFNFIQKLVNLLKNAYLHKSLLQEARFSAILARCYIGFIDLPLMIKFTNT
ncbi:hypothetical protein DKE47_006045 [Acinetobacter nosocomialis]|nr:hypothetical protein DKE47_006045 [Acinetobacter nosocomialis]